LLQIEIHPEVYKELEASKAWYEEQSRGLGDRFLNEIDLAMAVIRLFRSTEDFHQFELVTHHPSVTSNR
jgi:hypothetical protein